MKFSVVIPVFNEEHNLAILHDRLTKVMTSICEDYELIFVDDGSSDTSIQVIRGLQNNDDKVRAISFTRNFGQHPATMAGLNCATGKVIITIDADLQNPPEEIPKLINKLNEGYDVVFGVFKRRSEPVYRRAGSAFAKWMLSIILPTISTNLSGFRALTSDVAGQLRLFSERNKFIDGLLCWMGFKMEVVEVERVARQSGKSKYNLLKLISLWFDMVVSFTDIPLKFATVGGSILGLIGFMLAVFYFVRYLLFGSEVPGFATLAILLTVFSGVQLLCLGMIGEYIGRMNIEVKKKPEYVIREKIGWS
jgi:glycosyltransferase involved in cell wall biosynthesis